MIPIRTIIPINGTFYNFPLIKNIKQRIITVRASVRTLKSVKMWFKMSKGLERADSLES